MPTLLPSWECQNLELSNAQGVMWPAAWIVSNVGNEVEAEAFAFLNLPETAGGIAVLERIRVVERLGDRTWKLEAVYSTERSTAINHSGGAGPGPTGTDLDQPGARYRITGENVHVTQALETYGYPLLVAPNEHRAIGADRDGVKGADIPQPIHYFTVPYYFTREQLTRTLIDKWDALIGFVNNATWRTFASGEVRFEGAEFELTGGPKKPIRVDFAFARRRNRTNVDIGGSVGIVPTIEGWWIVDIKYEDVTETTAHKLIQVPKYCYLHIVCEYGDFADLGIPTSW